MDTRTFFFLKDTLSGEYYNGEGNWKQTFYEAAVYHQKQNAIRGMKRVMDSWEAQDRHNQYWVDYVKKKKKNQTEKEWESDKKKVERDVKEVEERKNLKDWGIEIVSGEIKI
jgi:hypothetical protein